VPLGLGAHLLGVALGEHLEEAAMIQEHRFPTTVGPVWGAKGIGGPQVFDHGEQPWTAGALVDRHVDVEVGAQGSGKVTGTDMLLQRFRQAFDLFYQALEGLIGNILKRQPGRQRLQGHPDEVGLFDVGFRLGRDARTLVSADFDEPLGFEAAQRFPDRYGADIEAICPVTVANPVTRLELATDDRCLE